MSVPFPSSLPSVMPAQARGARHVACTGVHGRHRLVVPRRATALGVVGRLGSVVTMAALLVLAGAVGSLFDGVQAPGDASTAGSVMFDDAAR
ncbi:MAG: hypothetical protein ACRDRK_24510 [Pseudonocardia sp.]